LVTGGAGYIGSHTCKQLALQGLLPVTYDNLSTGTPSLVRWGPLVVADIADTSKLAQTIRQYRISAVIHFAASAYVGESIVHPRKYFANNVTKSITLLNVLLDEGIKDVVFSSSCATYGYPQKLPITEGDPQKPVNPYGETKLAIERALHWYGEAYDLRWITLRYFNAAGADPDGDIGECHAEETHLIPLAIQATCPEGKPIGIFGSDYPTADGTAIRDFVHVTDLACAHLLALRAIESGRSKRSYNLGSGDGHSVRQIMSAVAEIAGHAPKTIAVERRAGDPAVLIADSSRARVELDWKTEHSSLREIIATAWRWHKRRAQDASAGAAAVTAAMAE
jgi:UDP-arabinose 4-epimerase